MYYIPDNDPSYGMPAHAAVSMVPLLPGQVDTFTPVNNAIIPTENVISSTAALSLGIPGAIASGFSGKESIQTQTDGQKSISFTITPVMLLIGLLLLLLLKRK
jgi:hypothetical protein